MVFVVLQELRDSSKLIVNVTLEVMGDVVKRSVANNVMNQLDDADWMELAMKYVNVTTITLENIVNLKGPKVRTLHSRFGQINAPVIDLRTVKWSLYFPDNFYSYSLSQNSIIAPLTIVNQNTSTLPLCK